MAVQKPESGPQTAARTPVWARARTGGRGPQPSLSVDSIVTAAVALADAEGVEAVSMRRIASELGVGTMSLYRYVETKDDLLDLMTDQVMGEDTADPDAADPGSRADWREDLRGLAVRYRLLMLRHPWVLPIGASRMPLGPNVMRRTELLFGVLDGLGLEAQQIAELTGTVVAFVRGVVLAETAEAELIRRTGQTEDDYRRSVGPYLMQVLAAGEHPRMARFVREGDDHSDRDREFLRGLDLVLDGVEVGLARLRAD
ncbi:TetR/AcrR family transcriptional regulator [Streptacidiphilus cavernicola]|uniref:TetR/AcrR family transcriptional regulator n=1 Tax=Streptacidiphilus cavernicola TaxID=3342716 RepID=A0ABV6W551_9ACTN